MLDKNGKFIKPHINYLVFLRKLTDPDIKGITLITRREQLSVTSF